MVVVFLLLQKQYIYYYIIDDWGTRFVQEKRKERKKYDARMT